MPKKIIKKRAVSLPEVADIFKKREKDSELNYLQRIAQEHAQQASKIKASKAKKIIKQLTGEYDLSKKTAITIVNFRPLTLNELRIFLQEESQVIPTEKAREILNLIID